MTGKYVKRERAKARGGEEDCSKTLGTAPASTKGKLVIPHY